MSDKISIAIGSDHAGFEYKELLREFLSAYEVKDFGTYSAESADYPDYARPLAWAVADERLTWGILVCGSGNGVAITANKHHGIRAGKRWTEEIAELARLHNSENVLCNPGRFVSTGAAKAITEKI